MHHRTMLATRTLTFAIVCTWCLTAWGLVNPSLQPSHLVQRHNAVIGGTISKVDFDTGLITVDVTEICFGKFAPKQLTIEVVEDDLGFDEESLLDDAQEGGTLVAFVGKTRRRHERDVLLYAGRQWHEAQIADLAEPGKWQWNLALGDEMVGTFNGAAEQLLAMMLDAAAGRDFFPAYPSVKFKEAVTLGTLPGSVRGVGLYDVDGDGRLDAVACGEQGNRVYLQIEPLKFADCTEALGLAESRGVSCSLADVNADGRADLLFDGVLYLGAAGRFERSELLPGGANEKVKSAALVEINGDGYPDVVISQVDGGLHVYLNPGVAGGAFSDATATVGLDEEPCGAGMTGFFAPGDFNEDGRTDLYYGVGKGLILLQDTDGRFKPLAHRMYFDYKTAGGGVGLTGAGCFAPLWQADSCDLVAPGDMHFLIVTHEDGTLRNVTGFGNEIRLGRVNQLATLAEDLNMDGYVDLLTVTRTAQAENVYHCNRGYGSYMLSELYMTYDGLPGGAFTTGAWGVAAGDVDGDGTTDLLLGGVDGALRLSLNDADAHPLRQPKEFPNSLEKKLQQTRILTVNVGGNRGIVGAQVRLTDAQRRVVARRTIGSQVLTGCCGPNTLNLAVREPGAHTLTVRFADGQTETWPADLTGAKRVRIDAIHGTGKQSAN